MTKDLINSLHQDRFDDALRRHHAVSVARLSPQVQAQLVQRRRAAGRGQAVHRGGGLRAGAAALATLCALAIGLQLRTAAVPETVVPAQSVASAATGASRTQATMLDEDPEFYAWLASSDAQQVAME